MPTYLGIALIIAALGCILAAWRSDRLHAERLDRTGRTFNVIRWEGESNIDYSRRIQNRICITGGRRW